MWEVGDFLIVLDNLAGNAIFVVDGAEHAFGQPIITRYLLPYLLDGDAIDVSAFGFHGSRPFRLDWQRT